jgi:hypothetical protein
MLVEPRSGNLRSIASHGYSQAERKNVYETRCLKSDPFPTFSVTAICRELWANHAPACQSREKSRLRLLRPPR